MPSIKKQIHESRYRVQEVSQKEIPLPYVTGTSNVSYNIQHPKILPLPSSGIQGVITVKSLSEQEDRAVNQQLEEIISKDELDAQKAEAHTYTGKRFTSSDEAQRVRQLRYVLGLPWPIA